MFVPRPFAIQARMAVLGLSRIGRLSMFSPPISFFESPAADQIVDDVADQVS